MAAIKVHRIDLYRLLEVAAIAYRADVLTPAERAWVESAIDSHLADVPPYVANKLGNIIAGSDGEGVGNDT